MLGRHFGGARVRQWRGVGHRTGGHEGRCLPFRFARRPPEFWGVRIVRAGFVGCATIRGSPAFASTWVRARLAVM
eukprot:1887431-Lingulodinium_polyedra.AAC.1